MSDNIEYNSARNSHSFFSRKEVAWHGLGQVIQNATTAEEALKLANLDYKVELKPLWANFIPDGCIVRGTEPHLEVYERYTNIFKGEIAKKGSLSTTHKAVCRMDNYSTLGIVGNRYTPVQNFESLNFIYDILKHNPDITDRNNIIIETAGVLGKGERIFVTAKLPTGFKVGNETDGTELYIVFTNSHDGTSSLTALVTPIRVVCANTLAAALGRNKAMIRFKHTNNIIDSMKQGMSLLNISYKTLDANKELYNHLLNIKVDKNMIADLICRAMLDDNQLLKVNTLGLTNVPVDVISTRMMNTIFDIQEYVDMGCGQQYNRGTAYWAYMGMNSYLNNGNSFKDKETKLDNFMSGTTSKIDYKILEQFKQL